MASTKGQDNETEVSQVWNEEKIQLWDRNLKRKPKRDKRFCQAKLSTHITCAVVANWERVCFRQTAITHTRTHTDTDTHILLHVCVCCNHAAFDCVRNDYSLFRF